MFIFCQMNVGSPLYVEQRRVAKHAMATFEVISSMGLSNMELQADRHSVCICLREHFVPFFDRIEDWSNKYKIQLFILNCVRVFFGRDHHRSIFDMLSIVKTLDQQAKYQEAVFLQEEVVELYPIDFPLPFYGHLETMKDLLILLRKSGRFEDAERMWKTILEEKERLYAGGLLTNISSDKNRDLELWSPIGNSLHGILKSILDEIDSREQDLGAEDPDTLMAGGFLACLLKKQGFLKSAETVFGGLSCCSGTNEGSLDLRLRRAAVCLDSLGSLVIMEGLRGDLRDGEVVLRNIFLV